MPALSLSPAEKQLQNQIEDTLRQLDAIMNHEAKGDSSALVDALVQPCRELHAALRARGHAPKHRTFLTENRGLKPDDPEFYRHYHTAESLLNFIRDTSANDDPIDQTLGHEFEFRVYTQRWGHDDVYHLTRTANGWRVRHHRVGDCDKQGQPSLFVFLNHDFVNYPARLGSYLESLWDAAQEQGLSPKQVQDALTELGTWVSACERNAPRGEFAR